MPESVRRRFYAVFAELESDPFRPRAGCDIRVLKGQQDARAIRVGDYRGMYKVVGTEVQFTTFGHRSKVYEP